MLEELALQRMEVVAFGEALDGLDLAILGLDPKHQAGTNQPAVENDAAGAAIAGAAALLGAGQAETVTQTIEQRLVRLADIVEAVAIDGGRDMNCGHHRSPAR
jgi:hypothetical protein